MGINFQLLFHLADKKTAFAATKAIDKVDFLGKGSCYWAGMSEGDSSLFIPSEKNKKTQGSSCLINLQKLVVFWIKRSLCFR